MKAMLLTTVLTCTFPFINTAQFRSDSIREGISIRSTVPQRPVTPLFRHFASGISSFIQGNRISGSFELSAEAYHYFLITGRRFRNDSIHEIMKTRITRYQELYRGFHFYLLNRASMDLDTLRDIANNYITSVLGSPLTLRINREFYLTRTRKITVNDLTPVLSLILTGDSRLIPYGDRNDKLSFGVSGHFFLAFSALFKRIEFDLYGREIDNGTMYLRPVFGVAYGTTGLMRSITPGDKLQPILTSGCRVGFNSDVNKISDFCLTFHYTLNDIIGPRIRAGILIGSGS